MIDLSPQTITSPLPAIKGTAITSHGVNYLRPEKALGSVTASQTSVRAATSPVLLYSTVGALRQVELCGLSAYVSGRVVYPISSLTMPDLCAKLVINATSQRLKFLESLITSSSSDNVHGMQILGLVLTFTVEQPV